MKNNKIKLLTLIEEELNNIIGLNEISEDYVEDNKCYLSGEYICDSFTEYANGYVDVYNSELLEWAKSNLGEIEEANNEYGTEGNSITEGNDIINSIMQAQFYVYSRELSEDVDQIIKVLALHELANKEAAKTLEVTQEEFDGFIFKIEDLDSSDYLSTIEEHANDFINEMLENGRA